MLNSLFSWLQPAPHIPEIQDKEQVKQDYKYWRIRILYSMFIGYAFYYFTRNSFTFAKTGMIHDLGFDKSQLGLLTSVLSISYSISKFASGMIADRTNPRYMMALGLILTGILNICFGLSSSLFLLTIFWGLNGWFQGFGWPPCARFLTQWYSHSERGSWWSTCSLSHNVGGFLIPWVAGIALEYYGWRYAMFIPGIACIGAGFFLINRLRDTPESLGLPPIEKYRNDYADQIEASDLNEKHNNKRILIDYVLKNPFIWLLGVAYFFIYVVRMGMFEWTALFLVETKGYRSIGASGTVSLFEVGGFFGMLVAGWSSDRLFSAKRGPVNVIFAFGLLISIILFWMIPEGYAFLDSIFMFTIGFAVFGPQMMIGLAATELAHKRAAASSNGFVGLFAYAGAAFAGYPLIAIAQEWGWECYFWTLMGCCFISILLLLPLWSVTASNSRKKNEVAASAKTELNPHEQKKALIN